MVESVNLYIFILFTLFLKLACVRLVTFFLYFINQSAKPLHYVVEKEFSFGQNLLVIVDK